MESLLALVQRAKALMFTHARLVFWVGDDGQLRTGHADPLEHLGTLDDLDDELVTRVPVKDVRVMPSITYVSPEFTTGIGEAGNHGTSGSYRDRSSYHPRRSVQFRNKPVTTAADFIASPAPAALPEVRDHASSLGRVWAGGIAHPWSRASQKRRRA